jgi:hypothetical protein
LSRAAAFLLALLAAPPVDAHVYPGERQVLVQAEPGGVAVLVTFRPPSGRFTDLLELDARFALGGTRLVKAVLAARALGVLELRLDGARLEPTAIEAKLVEDPPRSGRRVVAVLVSAAVPPGAHRLEIDVAAPVEPTATVWVDRSGGRIVDAGPRPAGVPFQDRGRLVLDWR